ncbi:hypothetical protein Zmor_021607 [Zophobas morio]|uniref:Gustatory receptor n=1 Tax=Zophobas morio TaxID=2755281 RepID=A0AA38I5W3_9CUCU|nr:hypothetical protein Zmor_021607 [Zophobas morio]
MLSSYAVFITLEESTQSKGRKLNAVVNGFRIFGASLTITLMLHKHTNLIECIRRMQSFDNNMKALGVESSYATHNVFVIFACTFIIVSQLCTTIMYWFLKRSIYLATCYFLSKGYQFIIIGIVVVYLNYFCFILGRKLHFLMKLTKSLPNHNKDPLKLLIMISEMYDDVFQTAKHINQMVSVPVLILTIGDILGGMITLYLMYHKEDNVVDEVSLGLHALQIICTLLPPMYIKKTPKKIARILTECEICYNDQRLAKARDTLLYQTLQQHIELTVCGLFPMSMSALSEQIGLCISIIFFLNQLLE